MQLKSKMAFSENGPTTNKYHLLSIKYKYVKASEYKLILIFEEVETLCLKACRPYYISDANQFEASWFIWKVKKSDSMV